MISAWKLLQAPIPLLIVGDGPMGHELREQATGLETVQFRGHLERSEALAILKRARFLVMPSECYENFPCAIAEAYADARLEAAGEIDRNESSFPANCPYPLEVILKRPIDWPPKD